MKRTYKAKRIVMAGYNRYVVRNPLGRIVWVSGPGFTRDHRTSAKARAATLNRRFGRTRNKRRITHRRTR